MKPLVLVHWHDAEDNIPGWVGEAEAVAFGEEMCHIYSVGYLMSKTAKYVTLAADWNSPDGDYGRVCKIPVGMIVSMETLKSKPKR